MTRRGRHPWTVVLGGLLALGAGACASPVPLAAPPPAPGPAEAARHRAALASVVVENRTATALTISFRPASPPGGPVGVGTVAAGAATTLAPLPAGEPIVLIARRADGAALELEPRSFQIDESWVWSIAADAVFQRAPDPQ